MADLTLVTGIADIGRGALAPSFARPFAFYRDALRRLLVLDIPMVVYLDAAHAPLAAPARRAGSRIVPIARADLERFSYFEAVQRIRTSPAWRAQATWLPESPQASLAHYNPLVLSKLLWLAEQARTNPFGTRHFAWIDGGIAHTVPVDLLRAALEGGHVLAHLRRFLLLCYPYTGAGEIHGFARGGMARYANVATVEWVARGGFFGGHADYVAEAARLYAPTLRHTLEHGYMGTEESVLTILAHLHPGVFDRFQLHEDGLVRTFFARVAAEAI